MEYVAYVTMALGCIKNGHLNRRKIKHTAKYFVMHYVCVDADGNGSCYAHGFYLLIIVILLIKLLLTSYIHVIE